MFNILCLLVSVILCFASSQTYNYEPTSSIGPNNWANSYPACSLSSGVQSPIHISMAPLDDTLAIPAFTVLNDGCLTWTQMTSTSYFYIDFTQSGAVCKNSYMSYEGQDWVLQQIKFKSPSEHTKGGGYFDGEVQFKHISTTSGHTAMVSVFLVVENGAGNHNNTFLNRIWNGQTLQSLKTNKKVTMSSTTSDLDPYADFFPANQAHYQYIGSATEPPCMTDVDWFVFNDPVPINAADMSIIRGVPKAVAGNILSLTGDNNRPEQHNTIPFSLKLCDGTTTYSATTTVSAPSGASTTTVSAAAASAQSATVLAAFAFILAFFGFGLAIYVYMQQKSGSGHSALASNEMYKSPLHM